MDVGELLSFKVRNTVNNFKTVLIIPPMQLPYSLSRLQNVHMMRMMITYKIRQKTDLPEILSGMKNPNECDGLSKPKSRQIS